MQFLCVYIDKGRVSGGVGLQGPFEGYMQVHEFDQIVRGSSRCGAQGSDIVMLGVSIERGSNLWNVSSFRINVSIRMSLQIAKMFSLC